MNLLLILLNVFSSISISGSLFIYYYLFFFDNWFTVFKRQLHYIELCTFTVETHFRFQLIQNIREFVGIILWIQSFRKNFPDRSVFVVKNILVVLINLHLYLLRNFYSQYYTYEYFLLKIIRRRFNKRTSRTCREGKYNYNYYERWRLFYYYFF